MNSNKIFKITSGFIIITTMLVMPFSDIQKVNAQRVVNYGVDSTGSNSGSSSLSDILGNMAPLISKLPGCTSILGGGGIKDLFSKKVTKVAGGKAKNVETKAIQKASEVDAVLVMSKSGDYISNETLTELSKVTAESKDINKATASDNKNNTCLNGIGKAVVKMLVDRMTISIVNWIQTGNSGDAFFLTNPSDFFKDLGKEQLLSFGIEISDPAKFPFGKSFMSGAAQSFNTQWQINAQYSLDKIMQQNSITLGTVGLVPTPQDFFGDFSQGGWGAWDAMVQNPANNPLGFHLIASNELQTRLAGTVKSPADLANDALTQGSGFMGEERCADPVGVTKEQNTAALQAGVTLEEGTRTRTSTNGYTSPDPNDPTFDNNSSTNSTTITLTRCKKWEYITPGKTIADQLTKKMDNSENALLSASTLNDAIAAILDAVTARLSSELTDPNKGLMGINEDSIITSYDTNGYENDMADYQPSQVDQDYSSYQRDSSQWLQGHPDFNILTDLTQALIDEQRIYIDKLKEQNYTILHKSPIGKDKYEGLIPTIYQLDYCIPGPHPGWEEDARAQLSFIEKDLSTIISNISDMTDSDFFDLLDSASMGALSTVVNSVNSATMDCGSTQGKGTASVVHQVLNNLTGLDFFNAVINMDNANGGSNENMCSADGFDTIMQKIMFIYSDIINRRFNKANLPSSAVEAEKKFNEIPGYKQTIKDNEGAIAYQEGIIKRLKALKIKVEALNLSQTDYEEILTAYKNTFAMISIGMVSGGDIATVADLTNQAESERLYILKTLIQGPVGCEQELSSGEVPLSPWQLWIHARPIYPHPILYTKNASTGYDYTKQLDGKTAASLVSAPAFSGSGQSVGFSNAFLGDVIFTSDNSLISSQHVESNHNAGSTELWFTDIININSGINTENTTAPESIESALSLGILNFSTLATTTPSTIKLNSPGWGGNAAFLEQYLKIY